MKNHQRTICCYSVALALGSLGTIAAALDQPDTVVVTASKVPESKVSEPASITVVSGNDLRARGANDLRTALSLVSGVDIAVGGDAGPAGSVPAMWGLREFDAFLLVVDGVPRGGVFNPELTTLDLNNVERIEVLRGAAPVIYGATSFVGIIQIIQYAAGNTPSRASVSLGSRKTGSATVSGNITAAPGLKQSFSLSAETHDFSQDRSEVKRGHALYRAETNTALGVVKLDIDLTHLNQKPYSPHPREGTVLTTRFPLDANVNPSDAKQDQTRTQINLSLDHGDWHSMLSLAHSSGNTTKGFLRADFATDGKTVNADGYRQNLTVDHLYFDSYLVMHPMKNADWFIGADWMFGKGKQDSDLFEYAAFPNGSNAPNSGGIHIDESTSLQNTRNFAGLYTQLDWHPAEAWQIDAGFRANSTREKQQGSVVDRNAAKNPNSSSSDCRNTSKLSGAIGVSYAAWKSGTDQMTVYADYRNTFKPAATDLGPEGEANILKPETAVSREVGLKGRFLNSALDWELSYFDMDFNNLVIRENVGGLPALANAGKEHFTGAELEVNYHLAPDLRLTGTLARHDAKFKDYGRLRPDGSIQQLAGKYLELSPRNLGALGVVYTPKQGLLASVVYNHVGSRFLNKGNTSVAESYNTVDAGLGYRFSKWELRLDANNLTNRRDAVAESEIGDAQFYRLPGRVYRLTASFDY